MASREYSSVSDDVPLPLNFRSQGRKALGKITTGHPVHNGGSFDVPTQPSIPSKMETILFKEEREVLGFGSHALRFEDSRCDNPGPGAYQTTSNFAKKLDAESWGKKGTGGFASKSKRFRRTGPVGPVPGPGAYDSGLPKKTNKDPTVPSAPFMLPCKKDKKKMMTPGPGTYSVPSSALDESHNVCAASFKKPSIPEEVLKKAYADNTPGPGSYLKHSNFVQAEVERLRDNAIFKHPSKRKFISVHPDLPIPRRPLNDPYGEFVRQCGTTVPIIPGPGTYESTALESNLMFNSKGSSFFSKPNQTWARPNEILPGPGNYDAPIQTKVKPTDACSVFNSGSRQRDLGLVSQAPGPAFYKPGQIPQRMSFHLNQKGKWV